MTAVAFSPDDCLVVTGSPATFARRPARLQAMREAFRTAAAVRSALTTPGVLARRRHLAVLR